MMQQKNLKQNDALEIFIEIIDNEKNNALDNKLYEEVKIEFNQRLKEVDWTNYYQNNPFKNSSLALYKWSPIADNLKILGPPGNLGT